MFWLKEAEFRNLIKTEWPFETTAPRHSFTSCGERVEILIIVSDCRAFLSMLFFGKFVVQHVNVLQFKIFFILLTCVFDSVLKL